jgi:hypothetical protein
LTLGRPQILWAVCVYLEAISVLPQLRMMQNSKMVERFTAHYVFCLGLSRFFSCAHWILQVAAGVERSGGRRGRWGGGWQALEGVEWFGGRRGRGGGGWQAGARRRQGRRAPRPQQAAGGGKDKPHPALRPPLS